MNIRGTRIAIALLVALLTASSLMVSATAAPEMTPGTVHQTSKQEKKQAADQPKAQAKAEKERKKYAAQYGLPSVTITPQSDCQVSVLVTNLVPRFQDGYSIRFSVQGAGNNQGQFPFTESPWRDSSQLTAQFPLAPGATLIVEVLISNGSVRLASESFSCNL